MKQNNRWYVIKRIELIEEFGGKCEFCDIKEGDIYTAIKYGREFVNTVKLEFAHKIGERISGMNRGRNARILEVLKGKHRFMLLCHCCHNNYDVKNPLTDEEKRRIKEEAPF